MGVWGYSPWSGGQGAKPPEADSILRSARHITRQLLHKTPFNLCVEDMINNLDLTII